MFLNIAGKLIDFSAPQVMGIINVTPDSFYAASRIPLPLSSSSSETAPLLRRAEEMIGQGATILDIGACSTRPGYSPVPADEEMRRLEAAFDALVTIRDRFPDVLFSVDTFRADIARRCVCDFGAHIINDISAGQLDSAMFQIMGDLRVPYVLTHNPSDSSTFSSPASFLSSVARFFADHLEQLHSLGVADVILDPGFGFGKTLEENYILLHHLEDLIGLFPDNVFLVGVSRKSMIYRLLGITPDAALNGTTVLNTLALQAGAHILRVHDVPPAIEVVRLCGAVKSKT